jgi:hypothetical protein
MKTLNREDTQLAAFGESSHRKTSGPRREIDPNQAHKGVALVLALVVVLVGGSIIALTFEFVHRFSWTSTGQRGIYVDHTTALSFIQAKIAEIVQANITAGKTMHVPALGYDDDDDDDDATPADGSLKLDQLRFGRPWSESTEMRSGTGLQRVETEVFDMHFMPEWVDYDHSSSDDIKAFPSVFNMAGEVVSGGYGSVGDHKGPGYAGSGSGDADELDADSYGAYLIRVRLYDHQGKLLRTAEEAFVQILPGP